jgi:hypothetical protein
MPPKALLNPAPSWSARQPLITLWHGCTAADEKAISSAGVDPTHGRPATDFGRGFYTTTIKRQARQWAWMRYYELLTSHKLGNIQPVVLRFVVDRHKLATLRVISFGVGSYGNNDFWSLVQHCRQSTATSINDHLGPVHDSGHWYDIACGPVAAFWKQRSAMHDADQISFHTPDAATLLTDLINSGDKNKYRWEAVS